MNAHLLRVVEHLHVRLLSRVKRTASGLDLEDFVLQDMSFESLLIARFTGICPGLQLDLLVIGHLEVPVTPDTADVLDSDGDLADLLSAVERHFAEVPLKHLQVPLQVSHRLVRLVGVVELDLRVVQGVLQFVVQTRELELLPQVGRRHHVVSHISEAEQGEVSHGVHRDEALLNDQWRRLPLSLLVLHFLRWLFLRQTNKLDVKVMSHCWSEGDVDFLLGLGVDQALGTVELKAVVQRFLNVGQVLSFPRLLVYLQSHFEFNVQVAVALVEHLDRESLGEADGDRSEVERVGSDRDQAVAARPKDFQLVADGFLLELGGKLGVGETQLLLQNARPWIVETNHILHVFSHAFHVDWNIQVVIFLFLGGEGGEDELFLVGHQVRVVGVEQHLLSVLLGHFPLEGQGNARLVLDLQLLLARHTGECGRKEQLGPVAQRNLGSVAETHQVNCLDTGGGVVEDALSSEVVEARSFGLELKANDSKRLPIDYPNLRIRPESLGGVLEHLEVHGSVASVHNLHSLVHRLVHSRRRKRHLVGGRNLDHGDEHLGAGRERVTDCAQL